MNATSPWVSNVRSKLMDETLAPVFERAFQNFKVSFYNIQDSCWLVVSWPKSGRIAFRAAYSPDDDLKITGTKDHGETTEIELTGLIGKYHVELSFGNGEEAVMRYTTTLTPVKDMLVPFWPRDIIPLPVKKDADVNGKVHVSQVGTRSGMLYFSTNKPRSGSVLYLQNLTALADYCEQTENSAGDTVGGDWPEIGFALPPTLKGKPLLAGKGLVISDAIVSFDEETPADEPAMVKQFFDLLSAIYLVLPKPVTHYQNWPEILNHGLTDLRDSPGCWNQVDGHHYFNAYVCDYATPPEIMVQLAVLLPLLDYVEWSEGELAMMKKIKEGLPSFYNDKLKTIMRWHPKVADEMEGEEEQKKPMVMDSWYLHHPLLNLSRLALKGDKTAEKLFVCSLDFAIKVAHHFNYNWPVFYKMDTLEVVKAETQPGKGGEKDVPGLYAHVMLQAWELTGERKYLAEAERSAQKLQGLGFDVFYQANNTAFSAGALLRLYKITNKKIYFELSYQCLAGVFKNVRLWDCNYGYGKNFPSFFTLFPLNDAPYSAVYEEQEVFCAFHDYLKHAQDVEILPSLRLMMSEYIRYLIERAVYYYPPMLPKEMLQKKPKIGEVDPNLWIALEDLQDGWEKSGQVGQEVYGAGNAFGILPRHYMQVPGKPFMIYVDYPTYGFDPKKTDPVSFRVAGDERMQCRLLLVKMKKSKLPVFTVTVNGAKETLKGKKTKAGHIEFTLQGDAAVNITWK